MLEYKISVVVNSTNSKAKRYLFECWGDNKISPQVAYMAGLKNKDYINHVYFDTLKELESILKALKERLSIPKEKDETGGLYLKTEYSQEEIEKIISDIENIAKKND